MFMTWVSTRSVGRSSGTVMVIGPSPRIWCSAGTALFARRPRRFRPRRGPAFVAVVHHRQALAFRILKIERQAAIALGDVAKRHASHLQPLMPKTQRRFARNAHAGT